MQRTAANENTGTTNTASSNTPKNFRHHPDMENFYRFIHENDLREEALIIIDSILSSRKRRKRRLN